MPEVSESFSIVEPTERSERCSARKAADQLRLTSDLPEEVRDTIERAVQAAWACDFARFVRIGEEGRKGFGGPTGFPEDMATVWRGLDPCEGIARNLVDIFTKDFKEVDGQTHHVYPFADRSTPLGIEGVVYLWPAEATSPRYFGHRLGIHEDGDWLFFAKGTFRYEGCRGLSG